MTSVYARTREREKAWKFGVYCLLGAIAIAPIWYLLFRRWIDGSSLFLRVRYRVSYASDRSVYIDLCSRTELRHADQVTAVAYVGLL